jgi:arsenate reductase
MTWDNEFGEGRLAKTMTGTFYHNPRCSKSREALKLLQDKGVEPQVVDYLKTPPDAAKLAELLDQLGMEPRELMRKKEAPYKELGLGEDGVSRDALIAAMAQNPILIERPIYQKGGKTRLGRPPEKVLELV